MLGFKKRKKQHKNTANAKVVKKLLGKDSGRRVFGFPCNPNIQARVKMLAGQLNIPMFALAEHALQIATELIAGIAEDPEESEPLKEHLIKCHVNARTLEKIGQYDREMADVLKEEYAQRSQSKNSAGDCGTIHQTGNKTKRSARADRLWDALQNSG